jgi:hypothetical protein
MNHDARQDANQQMQHENACDLDHIARVCLKDLEMGLTAPYEAQ